MLEKNTRFFQKDKETKALLERAWRVWKPIKTGWRGVSVVPTLLMNHFSTEDALSIITSLWCLYKIATQKAKPIPAPIIIPENSDVTSI